MQKNKLPKGTRNICGWKIAMLRMRLQPRCSQRALADKMQLLGLNMTKNMIQCIESGERSVTDIELKAFAEVFQISVDELLAEE